VSRLKAATRSVREIGCIADLPSSIYAGGNNHT
jgi:hypothetical protein